MLTLGEFFLPVRYNYFSVCRDSRDLACFLADVSNGGQRGARQGQRVVGEETGLFKGHL